MSRVFRIAALVAVPAMLAGHALASRLGTVLLGLPEHEAYVHAFELSLVPGLVVFAVLSSLALLSAQSIGSMPNLAAIFASLLGMQILSYSVLETVERHPTGWLGFVAQVFCSLIAILAIRFLAHWINRVATLAATLLSSHRPRFGTGPATLAFALAPIATVGIHAFPHAFSRPPPRFRQVR